MAELFNQGGMRVLHKTETGIGFGWGNDFDLQRDLNVPAFMPEFEAIACATTCPVAELGDDIRDLGVGR